MVEYVGDVENLGDEECVGELSHLHPDSLEPEVFDLLEEVRTLDTIPLEKELFVGDG